MKPGFAAAIPGWGSPFSLPILSRSNDCARGGYERVAVRAIPRNIPTTIPAPPATIAAHVPA